MLWRGRRPSMNVVDVRGVAFVSVGITWLYKNASPPPGAIIIDLDGSLYDSGGAKIPVHTQLMLLTTINIDEEDDVPEPTIGQIQTIDRLMTMLVEKHGGPHKLFVAPPETEFDVDITQILQSYVNNG